MKQMKKVLSFAALAASAMGLQAADIEIQDNITTDTTWSADNEYILGKPIFVTDGATLTIDPGTTIYGYENTTDGTFGSLVITRGSKIMAEGTARKPIVFTALAERDGLDDGMGGTRELTLTDSGLWGGVILLGNAVLNTPDNPGIGGTTIGEFDIEGFPAGATDLITYGGDNDEDDSGTLRFVSISYGGYEFATDEEINGLTLGAVGSGTTIEYVEVYNNQDDGVEFFGGTVCPRFMVMAFNEDESFDWDQGYRGKGQFWFAIQKDVGEGSNYGLEMDGGDGDDKTLEPYAMPEIYNLTLIGSGVGGANTQTNAALRMKDNTGGFFYNSIFTDFKDYAIRIDDADTEAMYDAGRMGTSGIIWGAFGSGDTIPSLSLNRSVQEQGMLAGIDDTNVIADPMLGGISRTTDGGLNPIPSIDGPAYDFDTMAAYPADDDVIIECDFKGAFSSFNWAAGWTMLSKKGYFAADDSASEFVGIATRGLVGTGDERLIGGFVITGDEPKTVFIRVVGPTYVTNGTFGEGQDVCEDPRFDLYSGQDVIDSCDNWKDHDTAELVMLDPKAPQEDAEPALVTILAPGAYTFVVEGVDGDTGLASVEVYEMN